MNNGVKYIDKNVFTPNSSNPEAYVERQSLANDLFYALDTPGRQIIVYGSSGSGKTTLLKKKLEQQYENEIWTQCMNDMSYDQLILNAFDQLNVFYTSQRKNSEQTKISSSLSSEYIAIKAQLGVDHTVNSETVTIPAVPLQLSAQNLAKFIGEANCCWVLDDFHKIVDESVKRKIAQTMKVFVDMSNQYPSTKIVLVGAVGTPYEVIEIESDMRNRVSEIYVPLMSDKEISGIIEKGESLMNFTMPSRHKLKIVDFSNGLASVCHDLCLKICHVTGIRETQSKRVEISEEDFSEALDRYIREHSDTLGSLFKKAYRQRANSKYEHGKLILKALTRCIPSGANLNELLSIIRMYEKNYSGNLAYHLEQLQSKERGSLIRKDAVLNVYSFKDPIYRAYAMVVFSTSNNSSDLLEPETLGVDKFQKILKRAILEIKVTSFKITSQDMQ